MEGVSGNETIKNIIIRPFSNSCYMACAFLFLVISLAGCSTGDYSTASMNFHQQGLYETGIKRGQKATALGSKNDSAWFWLGVNYFDNGQYGEAITALKKVIELNQGHLKQSYYYLGQAYQVTGSYKESIRYFSKRLEAGQGDWTYGESFYERTDSYLYAGMYDNALQDASEAMKYLGPNDTMKIAALYLSKAFSQLGLGEVDMALSQINKVKEIWSGFSPEHHLTLIYYATGNYQKVKEILGDQAWLGASYGKMADKGLELYVNTIIKDSPAEKGGLQKDDKIVGMNGNPVNFNGFNQAMVGMISGSTIYLEVLRGKEKKDLNIRLGSKGDKKTQDTLLGSDRLIAPLLVKRKIFRSAREAEKAGDFRKAFQLYRATSHPDSDIRKRIIKLYHMLVPPPVIPEEARKHAVFAAIATKEARDASGYKQAINEYQKAVHLAPWWADTYINLALLQEKTGYLYGAIQSLKFYLLASPDAPDADIVQRKLYELEFKLNSASTTPAKSTQSQTFVVESDQPWQDTGLQLHQGSVYRVTPQGTWSPGGFCGEVTASGLEAENLLCMKGVFSTPLQEGKIGALIGKVGLNGKAFLIGEIPSFIAIDTGTLFLRINDADLFIGDNSGQIKVVIYLVKEFR